MAQQFTITQSNYIGTSNTDNRYKLKFISPILPQKGSQIALLSATIPNSTPNITSYNNNNSVVLTWIDGTTSTYTFTQGNYQVSDIAQAIYLWLYSNNYYMNDANGNQMYPIAILPNSTLYSVNLVFTPIPTSADLANTSSIYYQWSKPTNATWSLPTTETNVSITMSSGFGNLLGYPSGTYGGGSTFTTLNSTLTPKISITTNYVIRCSVINNPNVLPDDILASIPISVQYGQEIQYLLNYPIYMNLKENQKISEIIFTIYGQDGVSPIVMNDNQITLTFLIKV